VTEFGASALLTPHVGGSGVLDPETLNERGDVTMTRCASPRTAGAPRRWRISGDGSADRPDWSEPMNRKKKVAAALAVVGVTVGGGLAWAAWTANGSGSGTARATTAQNITVNAATGAADLYPGFTGGDVFFTLTNPNPYDVTFTSMTAGAITSSAPAACPATNVTVAGATGLSLNVAANSTSGPLSIANVVTMALAAPNGCQGVSFTIALTLTGSQI
jgi:hypothetical protein